MQQQVAETVARATREEAEQQAKQDLDTLRRQAVEAGRERSRKIIKITIINTATGAISYNPAGRLLRDWYLHTYINALRANLNQPNQMIDAPQVQEAATMLRRVQPTTDPSRAIQAVGTAQQFAKADAAAAAAQITERLHDAGAHRAIRHAPDQRFEADTFRVHVTRHWYQRCYHNTVDEAVHARHPLAAVTDGEMRQVATTLVTREARRLISHDGIPLLIHHAANELAGRISTAPDLPAEPSQKDASAAVTERLRQAWSDMDNPMRAQWLRLAGAPIAPIIPDWSSLDTAQQARLTQHYLETHHRELLDTDTNRPRTEETSAEATRKMFNHPKPLAPQNAADTKHDLAQPDPDSRRPAVDTTPPDAQQPDHLRPASRQIQ